MSAIDGDVRLFPARWLAVHRALQHLPPYALYDSLVLQITSEEHVRSEDPLIAHGVSTLLWYSLRGDKYNEARLPLAEYIACVS